MPTLKSIYSHRLIIWALTIQTLKNRYAGTAFGILWSVLQPLVMVVVYWFVFSIGFKAHPAGGVSFIAAFLCAFIPWMMFTDALMNNVSTVVAHSYLVKKTVFPTEILPVVNVLASILLHAILLLVLAVVLLANGIAPSFWFLQVIYYFAGLVLFSLGISWLFSAMNVFYRDTGPMLNVIVSVWFWLTPIAWFTEMFPHRWLWVLKLNPLFHITEGYRASLIYHVPFWRNYGAQAYFWLVCLATTSVGLSFFNRLKGEFADVL